METTTVEKSVEARENDNFAQANLDNGLDTITSKVPTFTMVGKIVGIKTINEFYAPNPEAGINSATGKLYSKRVGSEEEGILSGTATDDVRIRFNVKVNRSDGKGIANFRGRSAAYDAGITPTTYPAFVGKNVTVIFTYNDYEKIDAQGNVVPTRAAKPIQYIVESELESKIRLAVEKGLKVSF
jgi:hypothetical protein